MFLGKGLQLYAIILIVIGGVLLFLSLAVVIVKKKIKKPAVPIEVDVEQKPASYDNPAY